MILRISGHEMTWHTTGPHNTPFSTLYEGRARAERTRMANMSPSCDYVVVKIDPRSCTAMPDLSTINNKK